MCWAAVGLIGSVVSGIGAASQASQAAANSRANAKLQREQANQTQDAGALAAQRKQREVDQVLGSQRSAFLGSGLALSGTPAQVIEQSAAEGAMDVAMIRYNSKSQADMGRFQSRISDANADAQQSSVGLAFLTPVIGGVAKYGSSFGQ
jgi:hypothetical protein